MGNDIIIEVQDDTQPTFQFSYPDLSFAEDGTVPSEEGCFVGLHYMNGEQFNMPGQSRSVETNVHGCQERCASIDVNAKSIEVGCIEFGNGVEPFALVDLYFASKEPNSFIKQI